MHTQPWPQRIRTAVFVVVAAAMGLLAVTAAAQAPAIDREEAIAIVTRTQLGGTLDGVRLWIADQPLRADETVTTWRRDVFRADAAGWFVFVDRFPGANWEHPCWYVFVDEATGEVRRVDATTPPTRLLELTEITDGRDNPPDGVSESSLARFSERLRALPKPPPAREGAWALIISGGADQGNNHIRYWNDCSVIYRALVEYYGYADDHIRVLISDGTNPAVDRSNGTNSPADLDGDGDADIEYPATQVYISQVFAELAATLTASDQLFIYTTDHGGQASGHDCYLNLWSSQTLADDQLAAHVATLPCQSIICTFEQCYSGGMIDDLAGDRRVIATAANWDELSWAMGPDYVYDTFVYHWTSAVAWETPAGVPVDADSNNDGVVSMHEAFLYAEAHDTEDETPQYSSTPAGLGDALNLIGNLEGVYLVVDNVVVDDDALGASQGDGDGVVEFGETVELSVALRNLGLTGAPAVAGALATTSSFVEVIAAGGDWGAIPSGGTVSNVGPLVFHVAGGVPDGDALGLALAVNETPHDLPLTLAAAAPAYTVAVTGIEDLTGDHDGLADPGETVRLTLRFANHGHCDAPALTARLESGGYFAADGAPHVVGPLAIGQSVDVAGFEIDIAADCPAIHTGALGLELTGPDQYLAAATVMVWVGPWFDDAEQDLGWTLGVSGDTATSGLWEHADPVGTTYGTPVQPVQPEDDHTAAPGHLCFVTGNGEAGGAAGGADVDGGATTLLSPAFDVAGASSVTLSYWRWYTNNLGNNPGQDTWSVDVTADGVNWIPLEDTMASANAWTSYTFDIGAVVPLTGSVRFRFIADDQPAGSLIEAAVDDITVSIVRQTSTPVAESPGTVVSGLGMFQPNPVGSTSVLSYRVAAAGPVRIDLYDVAGRRVRTLVQEPMGAGEHTVNFTPVDHAGRRIAAGVYFVRLQTPDVTQIRQVTVIR